MDSIATSFLKGFGVAPTYRPVVSEDILIGLLSTLAKHKLLQDAIMTIEDRTTLEFTGSLASISNIGSHKFLPFLHKSPEVLSLYFKVLPLASTIHKHEVLDYDIPKTARRGLVKAIQMFNEADIGIRLYLPRVSDNKLGVIVYSTREELMSIIQTLDLPEGVMDRVAL